MLEFDEKSEVKDYVIRTFAETGTWMAPGGRAFQVWKESSARREVRNYQWELKEENCAPDKFKLFTGKLPMSHVDQEDMVTKEDFAYIQPILQHIRLHFCNGEDEMAHYLLNWLAFPHQHLGQKTGVAVVIKSLPGTGNVRTRVSALIVFWLPLAGGCSRSACRPGGAAAGCGRPRCVWVQVPPAATPMAPARLHAGIHRRRAAGLNADDDATP
ncbi:g8661 [Coccomyxa elongata]